METETRQYKDVSGNPCTLDWLVKNEPEWTINQIRHRDKLEAELKETKMLLSYKNDTANTFMGQVKKLQSELEKEWIKNGELREQIERLKDKTPAEPANDPSSATTGDSDAGRKGKHGTT